MKNNNIPEESATHGGEMKAVVYTRYGAPEVLQLRQVPKPLPKDNEILIKVHNTTVTSGDVRLRKADPFAVRFLFGFFTPRLPILGHELAGVVEAVGSKVMRYRVGDRVFGSTGMGSGTYAEYISLPEDALIAKQPGNMGSEEAATLSVGAQVALHFLRKAGVKPGQRVLIHGASGSIGTAAVQIAHSLGAKVTAVCSTANVELVRSLGADEVIDYRKEDFLASGRTYNVVFSTVGHASYAQSRHLLAEGGIFLTNAPAPSDLLYMALPARLRKHRVIGGGVSGDPRIADRIKELIEAGMLKAVIDRRYGLTDIVEAHRYAEKGHKRGNVVINVAA